MEPTRRRLNDDEIAAAIAKLDGWRVADSKLHRDFKFKTFVDAMAFMNQVAVWAEEHDHHPDWSNAYNVVRVELSTHDLGGVSALDVQLATRMNELC